ncbi:VanZ family protein [Noviherbaspirillum malthae]|uniref:VanZ family protein n=1 Tax=Noviherbaspirillum malthae TaxID=1260987 RepID=UPI00188EF49D|nr:VanZ family protein [Noviherbaspirillum malthae]
MVLELTVFVAVLVAVSAGCLVPAKWLPPLPNDKFMHFMAYAGLALLAGRIARTDSQHLLWLAGLLALGWVIEILQNMVPGRRFCWRDMAANAGGIAFAAAISVISTYVHLM